MWGKGEMDEGLTMKSLMRGGHVWLVRAVAGVVAASGCASAAVAQSNIDAANKSAWQENCGWLNWRDAGNPVGSQGAVVGTFLSGFVWGENIGWINLGDGTPTNGVSYLNPTGGMVVGVPDFGVNVEAGTGFLTGFAWGENVGWINFSGGAMATPAQPARLDVGAGRLRGYAWGENFGWVNLDDGAHYVGVELCSADFNQSGDVTADDIFAFLDAWFAQNGLVGPGNSADFNGSNDVTADDIFAFLDAWFAQNGACGV